jgi:DNA-binding CsgD family transcriptional regulator
MARPFALQIAGEWRLAAQEWERLGCPYEQALALIDGDGAGMLAASDILARLGARPALEEARQRISAITARRLDKERYAGLTRREYDVAILIAQGKSNREIAQALTVGVKTVETYVTRMLSKLDFTSRVQIATWVVEKGLTQTPSAEP